MKQFKRPIPGQSLTDTPKNAPWERPSEMVEVGDVVDYYIKRMANEDTMDDMAATFKMGADVNTVTNALVKSGAMKGLHTVQAGMLAAPSVAAFIKAAMETYGLEVKETAVSERQQRELRATDRVRSLIREASNMPVAEDEMPEDVPSELQEPVVGVEEPEAVLAEAEPAAASTGLMARE